MDNAQDTAPKDTEKQFFSTVDAAAYTGYSLTWIKKLYYQGKIPAERLGHDLLFTKADLDAFLKQRGRGPDEPGLVRSEAAAYVGLSGAMFRWWLYHEDEAKRPQATGRRGKRQTWTKAALDAWKRDVLDKAPSTLKRQASQA